MEPGRLLGSTAPAAFYEQPGTSQARVGTLPASGKPLQERETETQAMVRKAIHRLRKEDAGCVDTTTASFMEWNMMCVDIHTLTSWLYSATQNLAWAVGRSGKPEFPCKNATSKVVGSRSLATKRTSKQDSYSRTRMARLYRSLAGRPPFSHQESCKIGDRLQRKRWQP